MSITVVNPVLMPAEIFLYVRQPLNPMAGTGQLNQFIDVCNMSDIAAYPIAAPLSTDTTQHFRTNTVTINLPSREALYSTQTTLLGSVQDLIHEMNAADKLPQAISIYVS